MSELKPYMTAADLASRWCMAEKTLSNWRVSGKGPDFIKIEGRVLYHVDAVTRYEREQSSTITP